MEKPDFINLLEKPNTIMPLQIKDIKSIIDEYPYFQAARVIYLKTLKDLKSFKYNNELKKTAAHTTDRTILFEFITSKLFRERKKPENLKKIEKSLSPEKETKINSSTTENEIAIAKNKLEIGVPLNFNKAEQYSFQSWLQITKKQPVIQEKTPTEQEKTPTEQESIIDKFINTNPKISKLDKSKPVEIKVQSEQEAPSLMTETLAKIYLEQKKYNSAIKAYEILSLKYPEKSGFFADRVNQIKILQKSK